MGRFVITIPPISIARELWRFGEPALSEQAAVLTASQAADIGERTGPFTSPARPRGCGQAVRVASPRP